MMSYLVFILQLDSENIEALVALAVMDMHVNEGNYVFYCTT